MHQLRRWLFLACLATTQIATAQNAPKRLSADVGCGKTPTEVPTDRTAAPTGAPPAAVSDNDARGRSCVDCGDEHFVPRRWHRFLPGMYR